jgi:hypothetical protein
MKLLVYEKAVPAMIVRHHNADQGGTAQCVQGSRG